MPYRKKLIKDLIVLAKKEGIERFVVGGVIIKHRKVLILQRSKNDFMGGVYEIPSGKIEQGETIEDALKREIKEETGLDISKILYYISSFDYISGSGKKTRQFNFWVETENSGVKLSQEHTNFAFVGESELNSYNITEEVRKIIKIVLHSMGAISNCDKKTYNLSDF